MDRRQLRYFLAVVDHGGVRRAAEVLDVAQPSVSTSLRKLERTVGAELFHRTNRGLVPNSVGLALVGPAREVLHAFEVAQETAAAITGLADGQVTVASTPTQSVSPLPELIESFHRRHPDVRVNIKATHGIAGISHALDNDLADLVSVTPEDLHGRRLIIGQPGSGMRRAADEVLARVSARPVVEVAHREALVPLVLRGIGVAIAAAGLRPLAEAADLEVRDLEIDQVLHLTLLWPRHDLGPAARAFLHAARDVSPRPPR